MTFNEKLNQLHTDSLTTQKEFLVVIQEIRATARKDGALPEELIFKREQLYQEFNKVLKTHRRLINYIEQHAISRSSEYVEGIEFHV